MLNRGRVIKGNPKRGPCRLFWWIWLIPGNICLAVLLLNLKYNGLPSQVVVTKHVYHSNPDVVWQPDNHQQQLRNDHEQQPIAADNAVEDLGLEDFAAPMEQDSKPEADVQFATEEEEEAQDQKGDNSVLETSDYQEDSDGAGDVTVGDDQADNVPVVEDNVQADEGDTSPTSNRFIPPAQIVPRAKKTFINFYTSSCSYLCQRLKAMGWRNAIADFPAVYPSMLLVKYNNYKKYKTLQRTIINQVGQKGSECIGGGKGKQLRCREKLAALHGCVYSDLGLQPHQWNIQNLDACRDFFSHAMHQDRLESKWIMKPGGSFHGDGITVHHGAQSLFDKYGACKTIFREGLIVQEYIYNPILWQGHKFDFRSYLLIASTTPFLVFHHEGFIRKAEKRYSKDATDPKSVVTNSRSQGSENHFFGFQHLQEMITTDHGFDANYINDVFMPHALRISLYLFHTAKIGLERRKGRYQMYALDWMMGMDGEFHLLEANGGPAIRPYPDTGLTPRLWDSMLELEEIIHVHPDDLAESLSVRQKYSFQGWRLVYNELELEAEGEQYNPCEYNKYKEEKHPLFGFAL